LENVDVLILPVETILTRAEVDAIVRKYDPEAVIPAHYFLIGLTTDISGLESVDEWVNDQEKVHHADIRRLDRADLKLSAAGWKDPITGSITSGTTLRINRDLMSKARVPS
jgi:hypothetical protein